MLTFNAFRLGNLCLSALNLQEMQETIKKQNAMKKIFLIVSLMVVGLMVSAQSVNDTTAVESNKPQIKIKVNKVYDENGNVVGYDSTYVWSYSNSPTGKSIIINPDSLLSRFKPYFNEHFQMPSNPFNSKFLNDSSMYFDFFRNNHFFDQWQNQLFNFKQDIERMDSLKRLFFKKYIEEQNEKEKKVKGKVF